MRKSRIFGLSLIGISIALVISDLGITGAVIGSSTSNLLSVIALVFFVGGVVLILEDGENYAQNTLDSGKFVDKTRELKSIAIQMGYTLVDGYREGTRVYKGDEVLTVIPKGKRIHGKGTSRSILEAMATGESNFRRRAS